ncbi:hypothetical protein V5E97_24415 [Singulisphaera sp. Ch08]|uniref:Uncharacterized protein n=1 Tax=Singulisphaera sp. Ch08 TaxID=3120278 RepID=A0AAU7C8P3_9BACT
MYCNLNVTTYVIAINFVNAWNKGTAWAMLVKAEHELGMEFEFAPGPAVARHRSGHDGKPE